MGVHGGPDIVEDGLVFAVDAGNGQSYVSASLDTFNLVGSQTGSLENETAWNSTNQGTWTFDGQDDYVKASLDGTSTGGILAATDGDINLTISLWVKIDTSVATQGIFQWANALNTGYPFILIQQNSLEIRVYVDGGYNTATSFSLATWYNVTVIRNSSTNIWTGYLDGSSFFTYDDGGFPLTDRGNADDIYLANGYLGYIEGSLANCIIYNKTLSAAEVLQNYNATKGRFI